jgi:ubiquitin-activating enzyme E1
VDDLISIFGGAFVERLSNSRTFLVGCGALGCEYLKNFALLGIGPWRARAGAPGASS